MDDPDPIQDFWDNLLSEEPERIRAAYATVEEALRPAVLAHLQRMVSEDGWHPQQRASARAALDALQSETDSH
ncbi:MAG TPA: hypothetical protein VHO48_14400 [Anaerolineaceae bacterium]|nr:hypothetical protein [Anaerolineaceae bacterium]